MWAISAYHHKLTVIRYFKVLVVVTNCFKTFESLMCPDAGFLVNLVSVVNRLAI